MKKKNILKLIELLEMLLNAPIPISKKLSKLKTYVSMSLTMVKNMLELDEKREINSKTKNNQHDLAS